MPDIRSKPAAAAAMLLGTGVLAAFALAWLPEKPAETPADTVTLPTPAQSALLACREHASMFHDVQWAAACVAHAQGHDTRWNECVRKRGTEAAGMCDVLVGEADDSPDCMLPETRAGRLNAELAAAENRCLRQAKAEENAGRVTRFAWLRQ